MKTITKIYDKYCDVCKSLEGIDEQIAEESGLFFKKITIAECASTPDELRKFVARHFVSIETGQIDVPVYVISEGDTFLGGSVVKTVEELRIFISGVKS